MSDCYNIYEAAWKKWGAAAQIGMLMEECAELIVAANKSLRGGVFTDNFAEELADVSIMVEQMKCMLPARLDTFDTARRRKLKRLAEVLGLEYIGGLNDD